MSSPATSQDSRVELLRWAAGLGAVTAEALALLEGAPLASARGRLTAATREGLLCRARPLTGRPAIYTLTRAGSRAAGLEGLGSRPVSAAGAEHAIACAQVAAALSRAHPSCRVMGEAELRARAAPGGSIPVAVLSRQAHDSPLSHRADLALVPQGVAGGLPVLIEVELSVKAPRRLEAICRAWARCRGVAGVVYLASPVVEEPLRRAIARASASSAVAVVPLASVIGE